MPLDREQVIGALLEFCAVEPIDTDKDEVPDTEDNCPTLANADQLDSDGDKRGDVCDDEAVTAAVGFGRGGGGKIALIPALPNAPELQRLTTSWAAYAQDPERGEIHPVWCDLDGDIRHELVFGLGRGGDGWLQIRDDSDSGYAPMGWIQVPWNGYNKANGETHPACADLDQDGRDELVVGLGRDGGGWVYLFDDAVNSYAPLAGGWLQFDWDRYNRANGAIHPALGNLDADPAPELVLGAGAGADGWVRVLDDLGNGFAPLTWAQHGASGDGATWPAVCNLGTGGGLLLGGGDGSNGALELLDPGADYALLAVSPGLPGYSGRNYPACANLDTDPEWEILVGQGTGAQSTLVLLDKGVEPIMLQPGGDGSTWPALPGRIAHDEDGDQVSAPPDNCPAISNPDQSDTDTEGVGDACDDDADNDGVHDLDDNCPLRVNREQGDGDEDDIGDICPTIGNALQEDGDSDGVGDFCDADRDGDGMPNAYEERYPSTLDPDDPDDAFRDPDDDKRNNLAESRADTAPNNPADIPAPWLLGIGLGRGGMGAVDLQDLTANQALAWAQTSWSEYATDPNRGEIRPAWCSLDGDPGPELVLGFGRGSDGWLEILDQGPAGGYQSLAWYQVDWRAYNSANGESYPACGDLDGDGSDELIVGLGSGGKGWFLIVDAPLVAERKETWRQLDWVGYNNQNGELHPGTGNLDADGADEIVLGFGPGGGGWLRILDDAQSGYAPTHWTRYDYPTYNGANGTTWPVVCENAGRVELLIGADKGASGWLQRRDPAAGYAPVEDAYGDWLQLDWSVYNRDNGRVVPVCGDTDDDGYDEVGLATAQGGWMQLRDDTETGFAEIDWLQFKLPGERFYNGNTWPTLR